LTGAKQILQPGRIQEIRIRSASLSCQKGKLILKQNRLPAEPLMAVGSLLLHPVIFGRAHELGKDRQLQSKFHEKKSQI
jgi:hypothetical protein